MCNQRCFTRPVLFGLGANIGIPLEQVTSAVGELHEFTQNVKDSATYRSEPVGKHVQPDFVNVVVRGSTSRSLSGLLATVHEVERKLGRKRPFPSAPRTIDIDILAYADVVLDTPDLVLPHPRLHHRAFVLVPLSEIAPAWRHPVFGKTAAELLAAAGPLERIQRIGPLPG